MPDDRTFLALGADRIGQCIMAARRRVIYAAPGASPAVAVALVNAHQRLGKDAIAVVLDVSETVCRLGYGEVDALAILREKDVPLRHNSGLRIAFLLADDDGFLFTMPPLLVEDSRPADDMPNAVRASREQIDRLVAAIGLGASGGKPKRPTPSAVTASARSTAGTAIPEIGTQTARTQDIEAIETAIQANPVEPFDVSRIVQVFSAQIQFFELEIRGTQLKNQTVKLPKDLLTTIKDDETRSRINAAFKLVSADSAVSGEAIHQAGKKLRDEFTRHHPKYGAVVLKADRAELLKRLAALQQMVEDQANAVKARFSQEIEKSIKTLVAAFAPEIKRNPPQQMRKMIGPQKVTRQLAEEYLHHVLRDAFPDAETVADAMSIDHVFKDVTWSTLQEESFIKWLREVFPLRQEMKEPFELYSAARQKLVGITPSRERK